MEYQSVKQNMSKTHATHSNASDRQIGCKNKQAFSCVLTRKLFFFLSRKKNIYIYFKKNNRWLLGIGVVARALLAG